jgi:DNA topoisomerase VI subunit B
MMKLQRTTFEVSRAMEFFTEKELEMQIGHSREWWRVALLKELVDNALDACETADTAPVVEIDTEPDGFSVRDNGPGLPAKTIAASLDYLKRASDKTFYVAPTRGQLGNALKVVWAAPFVANGEHGRVEVWTRGLHHIIDVRLDRIKQQPVIEHGREKGVVKTGNFVKVWMSDSSCLENAESDDFYSPPTARELVEGFTAFNPHASFRLGDMQFEATNPGWRKWKPSDPTSPHWYTAATLRDLIAAYIDRERDGGRVRTVREFVSEFRGLSSTGKQQEVTAGLSRVHLRDLVSDGDIDMAAIAQLLSAMQRLSKAPKPAALGIIGREHFTTWMIQHAGVNRESVKYVLKPGDDGMPFVVEMAFGIRGDTDARRVISGLNWSPALRVPIQELGALMGEMRLDHQDPITIVIHVARPRFEFADHGKTAVRL